MVAIVKPDMTRVWAAGAASGDIEDPDITVPGKFDAGWQAEIPPFENFNFLQQLFTQGLAYLNQEGVAVYDTLTDYYASSFAMTKGSDGNIYVTLIDNGPSSTIVNPVGDISDTWFMIVSLEQLKATSITHEMISDADYTLSTVENYKGRIVITDTDVTLTASRNIIVSDVERIFFAQNDTLEDLTFKTTAGTGITVTPGTVKQLYTDGINVIDAATASTTVIGSEIKSITASVSASALTVGLNADTVSFRKNPLTDGLSEQISFGDLSLVVPSGATLGTTNAVQSRLILLAINNAGTAELAIVNQSGGNNLDETTLISTTAIDAASDSANVIYSTTARTNVPFRVVGYVDSTQITAGSWIAAPTTLQGAGGNALTAMGSLGYGQTWQLVTRNAGTTYYNTTGRPITLASYYSSAVLTFWTWTVDGLIVVTCSNEANGGDSSTIIIPPGSSYVKSGSATTLDLELR